LLDDGSQPVVFDPCDLGPQLRRQRLRRRDLASGAPLRRPLRLIELTHAEAHRIDGEAALPEAENELRREHLELVRPDARRDLYREDPALERPRPCAVGDPGTDRGAPLAYGNGHAPLRKAIFARPVEQLLEWLGRDQVLSRAFLPADRHASCR
jgi:hypothetical protein